MKYLEQLLNNDILSSSSNALILVRNSLFELDVGVKLIY